MLQQTQVVTVVPYYHEWLLRFPDFAALACASENDVLRAWQGLGYYARARNLHRTARIIVDRHHERFPRSIEQMRRLPGIGRYTAGALMNFAHHRDAPMLDTNVARLLRRHFGVAATARAGTAELWMLAATMIPKGKGYLINQALMDLGAMICRSRSPRCDLCPLRRSCRFRKWTRQGSR